ncbi:MAG: hypothetical protein Q8P18_33175 [Pseudomonadota bacterium]|nr:hypothetical protein [Pseudomonadota bacterium]
MFLWLNQTNGLAAVNVRVDFAIRESASPGTPEWLVHTPTITLTPGGAAPNIAIIQAGAVWIRVVATGLAADVVEVAASAFV